MSSVAGSGEKIPRAALKQDGSETLPGIEGGWKQKARQRSSRRFGGQNFVQFVLLWMQRIGRIKNRQDGVIQDNRRNPGQEG